MGADLKDLEATLGHTFRDRDLLVRALTHRSFSSESKTSSFQPDNEQLEFFGDAILGFVISDSLIASHPGFPEGKLSRAKSHLVSARHLHHVAQTIGLGEYLQLGRGEERGGGRGKPSLLANAMEALIAALYLDGGMDAARPFILRYIQIEILSAAPEGDALNYKGLLWERAGAEKLPKPEYMVLETTGPAHAPVFRIEARLGALFSGTGEGSSKKAAEQRAAQALLESMTTIQK